MSDDTFFNLLKPIEEPKTSWDLIYDWILGKARIVLLIIEIIMVLIFFAKVYVDNVEKNLLQEFDKAQLQLLSLEDKYEDEIIEFQNRVLGYGESWLNSAELSPTLREIMEYVGDPSDQFSITLNNNGNVQIAGYESLDKLRNLESDLKKSDSFTSVTVETLSLEQADIFDEMGRYSLKAIIDESISSRKPLYEVYE